MPAKVNIEGVPCTIEKLPNGNIRVSHQGPAMHLTQAAGTGGEFTYEVHPCQQHQFQSLNSQLPEKEQVIDPAHATAKPWWSLGAGERAGLRD